MNCHCTHRSRTPARPASRLRPRHRALLVATGLLLVALVGASSAQAGSRPSIPAALKEHASAIPSCPADATMCIGIRFFVAQSGGKPVVKPEWLAAHVQQANLLLSSLGVAFQLYSIELLPGAYRHLRNRGDRDRMGARRWQRGFVNVFVAEEVENVDGPGQIYGVHWRWRGNKAHRWIILSAASWPMTLVHELGHYFGLAHNEIVGSIMNHTGKDPTPTIDRRFTVEELLVVKQGLEAKLKSKELIPQLPQLPPLPE